MAKVTKAVGELLEKGTTVHVQNVVVADASDAPAVHMQAVLQFVDGLRTAIRNARNDDMDTVTATNHLEPWERLCNSMQVAANALAMHVVKQPPRRRSS